MFWGGVFCFGLLGVGGVLLVDRMGEVYDASPEEWTYSGAKYGWNAKIRRKKSKGITAEASAAFNARVNDWWARTPSNPMMTIDMMLAKIIAPNPAQMTLRARA